MKIKQVVEYFIRYMFVFLILSIYILEPMHVSAASSNTLRGLKAELADLQAQKRKNDSQQAATESEIRENNIAILNAQEEIEVSQEKIENAKVLIAETDEKIAELHDQTEKLMAYFQLMQGENVYLEFITESSSMTDLVMRSDAINQIVDYNQKKLVELKDLIEENEQLQVDLIKYEEELEVKIADYEEKISSLEYDLSSLGEVGMDIEDEIRSKEELIEAYENMGCEEDQDLDVCASINGSAIWYKPLNKGRISSIFGVRTDPFTGKKKVHKAVDIAGNSEGTSVYSVGNGIVVATVDAKAKYNRGEGKTCGGNQVYIQVLIGGEKYTVQYAHLLTVDVKVGDVVNVNTVIGKQGGGSQTSRWESCSTGSHLHFGVVEGYVKTKYMATYFNNNAIVPPGFPNKGAWFYSRTQWFA